MSKSLKLADDLKLPADAVTQTFLVVGKRGSGKSNTAARFVEQLHHAGLPFVVLDPVDTWWGLKAGRDGGRGLDVYVFGGRKADLPLEAGGGALIAEVLCEHRLSMVLSVKHLSGRERSRFMVAFAQTLFQKWGGGPLHVVLEEAHELAPQMGGRAASDTDGEAAMLGAFKRLWKLGRASGIGGTAVTQRPASLSKDITTQSEILIAHRTIGPQDVAAIGQWVKYHGEREDILAELPTLPTGEAFVWAPEFPEGKPIGLTRTSILLRETYDSASTPKVGEHRVDPKELAAVDLERLRSKMAATIEKAKAEDPRELRKELAAAKARVQQLEREGEQAKTAAPAGKPTPVLTEADRAQLASLLAWLTGMQERLQQKPDTEPFETAVFKLLTKATQELEHRHAQVRDAFLRALEGARFAKILEKLQAVSAPAQVHPHERPANPRLQPSVRSAPVPARLPGRSSDGARPAGDVQVKNGKFRSLMTVLAQMDRPLSDSQLAARAAMALSGTFDTYIGQMRSAGWVVGTRGDLQITEAGRHALGDYTPLPQGAELRAHWLGKLSQGKQRRLAEVLFDAYPQAMTDEALAAGADMARSGTFDTYLGQLRALQLITGSRQALRASDELFS